MNQPVGGGMRDLSVEEILESPSILEGLNPGELLNLLGGVPPGFTVSPGQSASAGLGPGWKLSTNAGGNVTIRWSPGSARSDHPDRPYWRVNSGKTGPSSRINAGDWPDAPSQFVTPPGDDEITNGVPGACDAAYVAGASCGGPFSELFGGEEDEEPLFVPEIAYLRGGTCAGSYAA